MIDLKNTYIKNEDGELRNLYIAEINKQGLRSACGYEVSIAWTENSECIEIEGLGLAYRPPKSRVNTKARELTLSDLKPRTKTEYVKVDKNANGGIFSLGDSFKASELFFNPNGNKSRHLLVETELHLMQLYNGKCSIYRKIETEIKTEKRWVVYDSSGYLICSAAYKPEEEAEHQVIEITVDV